jgi:hypothetical protein
MLLLQVGPYREAWEKVSGTIPAGEVSQAAVCEVIAQYLYDDGHPDTDIELARRLKDRVSRAFGGKGMTPQTLEWFIRAFDLSPHDTQRVRDVYRGGLEVRDITGTLPLPNSSQGTRRPDHRTSLLFEHHYVGRDGLPVHHHTQQTICSLVDGLDRYQCRMDTSEAEVRVRRGGVAGPAYSMASGMYGIDILFPHPLRFGETQYLDYWTNLHYTAAPAREFRRGAHHRVEHLDMRVEFHRDMLPSRIWWAQWSGYLDVHRDIVEREELTLDEERSAHRYLDAIEHAVVGFYWEW